MAERDLWTAVLLLAVEDATFGIGGESGSSRKSKLRMIEETRTFLTTENEDLQIVCDGADLDMMQVIEHMRKRIAEAPTAEELLDGVQKRRIEHNASQRKEQEKRSIPTYTHNGETLTLAEWSERTGLKVSTIHARLGRGWPLAKALSVSVEEAQEEARQEVQSRAYREAQKKTWRRGPPELTITHNGETLTVKEWSWRTGINAATIKTRLRKGMPTEKVLTVGDLRGA
ncbi:hypothetical protein [Celeribacter sp.]|uniref:hypothetical protein n=1 Tax=Celeribacter sp. TaxID=1890673 RepID=UPI003A8E012F